MEGGTEMPRVRLTQAFVADLLGAQPPPADEFYWSDRTPGFGAKRKAGSGRVSFVYQWRDKTTGRSHRMALGDASKVRLEDARALLNRHAAIVAAGGNPLHQRKAARAAPTFRDFVENAYLTSDAWRRKAPSTRAVDQGRIERFLLPALGDRKLAEITRREVSRLQQDLGDPEKAQELARRGGATKRTRRGGEGGARRTMRLLKAILALAVKEDEIAESPAAHLTIGTDGERDEVPDEGAYARLWQALERLRSESHTMQRACDCIAIIALTGARKAEVQRLRWRHVDLDGRRLVLLRGEHKTGRRTGKPRIIALPEEAVAVLSRYRTDDPQPDALVFSGFRPSAPVALQRPWQRIAALAELPPELTLHSLRHGVGTLLAAEGATPPHIATALGHQTWRTSQRYVHAVDRTRDELARRAASLVRPKKLRAVE